MFSLVLVRASVGARSFAWTSSSSNRPAKAKTINKYLGPGYKVLASYGHVRDLPAKDGSVRPDDDFAMDWEVDAKSRSASPTSPTRVKRADRADPRHRPRPRGRGDLLARAGGAEAEEAC